MGKKLLSKELTRKLYDTYQERVSSSEQPYNVGDFYRELVQSNPDLPFGRSALYNRFKWYEKKLAAAAAPVPAHRTVVDLSGGSGEITAVTCLPTPEDDKPAALPTPEPISPVTVKIPATECASEAQMLQVRCCGMDFRIGSDAAAKLFLNMVRELKTLEQEGC